MPQVWEVAAGVLLLLAAIVAFGMIQSCRQPSRKKEEAK